MGEVRASARRERPPGGRAGLSLRDYRCGVSSNPCAIPHRHLKKTHAYRRHWQTEHQDLGAKPKLAELVKVILWVDPEIEIVGNHSEPKRPVQNAGNSPPCRSRHAPCRKVRRIVGKIVGQEVFYREKLSHGLCSTRPSLA